MNKSEKENLQGDPKSHTFMNFISGSSTRFSVKSGEKSPLPSLKWRKEINHSEAYLSILLLSRPDHRKNYFIRA